jgi:uncharacterized protein YecE (DUF72 family)
MIRIGTCGFSFRDWKGTVYPSTLKPGDYLVYYARELGFDTVEIDASYYSLLPKRTVQSWAEKTPSDFLFSVKCHQDLTLNEPGREALGEPHAKEMARRFLDSFEPLSGTGKLLTFLAQFGPLFSKSGEHMAYLQQLRELLGDSPLVAEFRHRSWLEGDERESTFAFLEKNKLMYATVDLPQVKTLPPFVPHACGDLPYVRLHGRNREWFTAGRDERYNYLYREDELRELMPSFIHFEGKKKLTVVYFNNCHAGAAMKNALKLKKLLNQKSRTKPSYVQGEFNFETPKV